jgi:hypothetical protein
MGSNHSRRLAVLEATLADAPCATCQTWPPLVVHLGSAPAPPVVCPVCGREASQVVCIVSRDDGPQ